MIVSGILGRKYLRGGGLLEGDYGIIQQIYFVNMSEHLLDQKKRLGNYSYVARDVIGKGYSSVVYRAQHDSTGQTLALKLIDMKNIKGEVHKTLLNNEIEILRLLSNLQNIIKLYEILPYKSHTCIVTELCDGGDLSKMIKTRKAIPERQAQEILKEIINGYRGINRFGIVHRDLKPANIFFNEGKVKIADFGFAIKNADLKKSSNYNVGSPVYMPLEALNDNLYSSKSDIWAIGVIYYEMLTGHTPWKAKTEVDLKRQIKAISIKSLIPAHISRISSDFLLKSLQLNSNLRMSAEEMVNFFDANRDSQIDQSLASTNLRTNNLFRTRAISQDRQDRNDRQDWKAENSSQITKNTVTAPKSSRKVSRLADYNGLEKKENFKMAFQNTGFERFTQHKLGNLARTTAALGEQLIPDFKKLSSHLLSQIHFCRFFYKLVERMERLGVGSERLKILMSAIVTGKLHQIKDLTMINPKYAVLFKRTKECERIQEVVQQYLTKYARVLRDQGYQESLTEIEEELSSEILSLYQKTKDYRASEGKDEEVILLDYFITTKQLLLINAKNDIDYFHKKSKIEAIVEGRPAKTITEDHFEAIVHKLRVFKMIS